MLTPSPPAADATSVIPPAAPLPPTLTDTLPVSGSEYLLVCEAYAQSFDQGTWQFTLEQTDGTPVFSADDIDIGDLNRLTLLAAVRGLESIDGPSAVTLLSNNRYLIRSLSDSLPRWRANNFVWEHFGRRLEVQHADLWRRIDRALLIHRVEAVLISSRLVSSGCHQQAADDGKSLRIDSGHPTVNRPRRRSEVDGDSAKPQDRLRQWLIGGAAKPTRDTARRRFTATELLQSS